MMTRASGNVWAVVGNGVHRAAFVNGTDVIASCGTTGVASSFIHVDGNVRPTIYREHHCAPCVATLNVRSIS